MALAETASHFGDEVADAVAVDGETEFHLGRDLVALGDRDLAHVVTEADEAGALPILPRAGGAHPGGDAVVHLGVGPVADDNFAREAHARVDEPGLAVAVGGLVEVHEIHVDRAPREVAIELGVEVEERFLQQREAADPHLGRRKCVHPQHEAGAGGGGVGVDADLRDLVGRREKFLEDDLVGEALRGVETLDDFLGIFFDLRERAGP